MPKGTTTMKGAIEDVKSRRAGGGEGSGRLWFGLKNSGDSATVRFLEEGDTVNWAWKHQTPPTQNRAWGDWIPCRDQDENGDRNGEACPGCENQYPRKFRGVINMIWRDAPVYAKDAQGKLKRASDGSKVVEGSSDQVAVWEQGVMLFEELDGKDVTYKGLMSRDFKITRRGTGMDTKYQIDPADPDGGPQPMSKADEKLAAEKYDLSADVTPEPYETWGKSDAPEKVEQKFDSGNSSPFKQKQSG